MFTFGYNANFAGHSTSLNILDFAKDLLFRMKTHSGPYHPGDPLIGEVCFLEKLVPLRFKTSDHLAASDYLCSS